MPDVSTEVAIATTTLGSAASTITFSSIPATYTDLRLVLVGTGSSSGVNVNLRLNNDSGTNYSQTSLVGNGSAASSYRSTSASQFSDSQTYFDATVKMKTFDIMSYAGSTNKTVLFSGYGDMNGSGAVESNVGLYRSTSVINRIDLSVVISFLAGTTATLYGIL